MKTFNDYLNRALRNGSGIQVIIGDIDYDVTKDIEIDILTKAGYLNEKNITEALKRKEEHYSVSSMFDKMGENGSESTIDIEIRKEVYNITSPFSDRKIKMAVAKLEKQGKLVRKGWSDNQIKKGNYSIELK
jgi:ferritin-like metal-binding protein YciE